MEFLGECGTKYDNRYSLYFNIKVYFKFYHLTPYNGDNMKVNGKNYTSIWFEENNKVFIIDQRWLPHADTDKIFVTPNFFRAYIFCL